MATATIPLVSTEYLYFPGIFAFDAQSPDPADPRTLPVSVSFGDAVDTVAGGTWYSAQWVAWNSGTGAVARYLLSPAGIGLTKDVWNVWLRITGGTEIPIRMVGTVTVT